MNERSGGGPRRLDDTKADTQADTLPGERDGSGLPPAGRLSSSSGSLDGGRFTPGEIVDARYRVVGLVGRGGMGEVYRAEDLRLGETVALKFLPERLARDGAALARFHREVRTARQITHRGVVRVHDLGEVGGQPFLSMEYVDGEDLASLLRRIGRLPADKAVELAHQLCAGLAAAHERGVLHRDLKPANVLVDGRGHAKITDFGLAALATELESPELAGTPIYMAPEQLREGRVSYASDLYSLGLVLYEMFTGQRPFDAESPAQLLAQIEAGEPPRLSTRIEGVDARVESAIARCLRRDPGERPRSALDVSAALPGGDPLQAAIAAGETPSPEMVARARGAGTLSRPVALGLAAVALAGMIALVTAAGGSSALTMAPSLPPEVLAHEARSVLALAGYAAAHDAWGFGYTDVAQRRLSEERHPLDEWREIAARRPGFIEFWYRQAGSPLLPARRWFWRVTPEDPPIQTPGTATVTLDGQGRLRTLLIAPADRLALHRISRSGRDDLFHAPEAGSNTRGAIEPTASPASGAPAPAAPDWAPLFAASALPMETFTPTAPERAPPFHADRVTAWTGTYPGQDEPRVWIDAAAREGEVVFWQVREELPGGEVAPPTLPAVAFVAFALMWIGGGVLARRHMRSGSGDRRGALRLAAAVGVVAFVGPLLLANHSSAPEEELPLVFAALAQASMLGLIAWLVYMALEPYARRVAPRWVVSWTRLLEGRFRDPMVGRDLLYGLAAGAGIFGTIALFYRWQLASGDGQLDWGHPHGLAPLEGVLPTLANAIHPVTLLVPFGILFVLVASRALVPSEWGAAACAVLVVAGFNVLFNGFHPVGLASAALLVLVGFRWGLLALLAVAFVIVNLMLVPASLTGQWWSATSALGWGLPMALALWSYRVATRRPEMERAPPSRG